MDRFADLQLFLRVARLGSLRAAAQELGLTPPAVSKRLAALEARLGVRLLNRTTRRLSVTPEGETYLADGARLLAEFDELERGMAGGRLAPQGLLRINASFGFGRRHVAPMAARFAAKHPRLEVQLQLTDRPMNLVEHGYDLGIRVGELADTGASARLLARNRRVLCASPDYLRKRRAPATLAELSRHACIVLREDDAAYGLWRLTSGTREETVKVRGSMSTNDGECAVAWALAGFGILHRSEWDVAQHEAAGRLVRVLPDWSAPADIHAVFPTRQQLPARVRRFVDFMAQALDPPRS